jgi:hypothetical protein
MVGASLDSDADRYTSSSGTLLPGQVLHSHVLHIGIDPGCHFLLLPERGLECGLGRLCASKTCEREKGFVSRDFEVLESVVSESVLQDFVSCHGVRHSHGVRDDGLGSVFQSRRALAAGIQTGFKPPQLLFGFPCADAPPGYACARSHYELRPSPSHHLAAARPYCSLNVPFGARVPA